MENINLKLYKLTQEELFKYLKKYLNDKSINFVEIDNQIISLNHENNACFVSHMDTVNDDDMKKELIVDTNKGEICRKDGILGADDRAGINIILNHCDSINFIFTRDEEIGCIGIRSLVNNYNLIELLESKSITCCIELDRKGSRDILGHEHGYCGLDLSQDIMETIAYHEALGVLTDIDEVCEHIASCNLSIGYHNAHSKNEYLKIDEYNYINNLILKIVKATKDKKYMTGSIGESYNYYFDDDYINDSICSSCGKTKKVYYVGSLKKEMCYNCIEELLSELDWILSEECN